MEIDCGSIFVITSSGVYVKIIASRLKKNLKEREYMNRSHRFLNACIYKLPKNTILSIVLLQHRCWSLGLLTYVISFFLACCYKTSGEQDVL